MSVFTLVTLLFALLVICWAVWFLFEFIRYVLSGEYEMDKRIQNINRYSGDHS